MELRQSTSDNCMLEKTTFIVIRSNRIGINSLYLLDNSCFCRNEAMQVSDRINESDRFRR